MKKFLINKMFFVEAATEQEAKRKASIISPAMQTMMMLEALCVAKGKTLEDIISNLNVAELKKALKKYPDYRKKLPRKIQDMVKPVIVTKTADVIVTLKVPVSFKVDNEWTIEDIKKYLINPATKDMSIATKSGLKDVTIVDSILTATHLDEESVKEVE